MVGIFRNTNDKEANFCFVQRTKRNPKGRSLENETAKEKAKVYLIDECCLLPASGFQCQPKENV